MGYVDFRFIGDVLRNRLAGMARRRMSARRAPALADSSVMLDAARRSAVIGIACGALALLLLAGVP
jgi:hypothetical protein